MKYRKYSSLKIYKKFIVRDSSSQPENMESPPISKPPQMDERTFEYFRKLDPGEQMQPILGSLEISDHAEFFPVNHFKGQEEKALEFLKKKITEKYRDILISDFDLGKAIGYEKGGTLEIFLSELAGNKRKDQRMVVVLREISQLTDDQLGALANDMDSLLSLSPLSSLIRDNQMWIITMMSVDTNQRLQRIITNPNRAKVMATIFLTGL